MALRHGFFIILAAACLFAQPRPSVFVFTDAEGVAGICRQEQVEPTNPELKQLLTGEINAAVEGFFLGGAREVIVWDGHDGSRTLTAQTIDPRAKLVIGGLGVSATLDRHYDAIAFIGQHARAGVRAGIMAHSYSSLGIQNMLMNGKPVGETETRAALAGWFDTPVIFLTGDRAAVEEMRAIVPDVVTAEVKEGVGRYSCISLSAQAARDLITQRAREAVARIGRIKPYKVTGPVTIQIEYTTRNSLSIDAGLALGAEVLDDRTVRYTGKDFMEAWKRSRMY